MYTLEEINELIGKSARGKKAAALFKEGYNCAQAMVIAFSDMLPFDENTVVKLVSGFGGGMGRMREVCGAFSGAVFVISYIYGYNDPSDFEGKKELYGRIQLVADKVKEINGSIVCKELLGLGTDKDSPVPEKRTDAYYKKRPCDKIIGVTAAVLEEFLNNEQ
ncbi:MAG: C-GCAxxG-C-C family protein [Clostridiales bacterium]|nr:C-GCAxxG-C-C family protein [Clostridiales bacterium]